jgi:hypothetical protein
MTLSTGSGTFWRGFANGFAPERYLLTNWSCHSLVRSNSVGYAWESVGKFLEQALDDAEITYDWSGTGAREQSDSTGAAERGFSGFGWRPVPAQDADVG